MSEVDSTTYQSIGGKYMADKPKLGSGGRFAALKAKIGKEKGVDSKEAGAIAANAGRKKLGKEKFEMLAIKGRKDASMAIKGRMDNEAKGHEKVESKAKETKEDK